MQLKELNLNNKIMKNLDKFITYISFKLYGKRQPMWTFQ